MLKLMCILSMLFCMACGESPILNHTLEAKNKITGSLFSESEALKFSRSNHSFIISWQEGPEIGTSKFLVKSWNNSVGTMNGPYQDFPKTLHVFLWMPDMGHGSAPVKLTRLGDGEYQVSDVQFIMGGKWEIKFQLKDGSQVLDEVIVPLSL